MILADGYYVFAYCQIDPILHYNKTSLRHDHNLSLWKKDGECIELMHFWELERRTGLKHHEVSFYNLEDFYNYLEQLISEYGISLADIQQIIGLPGAMNYNDYHYDFGPQFTYHAASHIYSSLLLDSDIFYHENILSLALDRGSDPVIDKKLYEQYNFMGAYSVKGRIELFEISSPGLLWSIAYHKYQIREGTLMALAYASESATFEQLYDQSRIIQIYNDSNAEEALALINELTDRIFSYQRKDEGSLFNFFDERFSERDNKLSMVMKILQEISIAMVDKTIQNAVDKYQINVSDTYLALSGGYALNCPTNTYIMHKYGFKGQLIPPCTNDGGQALGMGLLHFVSNMERINFKLNSAYYGDSDTNLEVLHDAKFADHIERIDMNCDRFVEDLVNAPIVWFDGRAEIGPRALGHRSILADARRIESKDLMNQYKRREWWRPVAPIVLEEAVTEWFEDAFTSPYMLNNFVVKDSKRELVPAIMHLDHTARVQTINRNENERLHRLLSQFAENTGVPIICNTSLNDHGEPIINTLSQALNFALRKFISVVYFNGIRIELKNHAKFETSHPEPRDDSFFCNRYSQEENAANNPFGLTLDEYIKYCSYPEMASLSIRKESDVKMIKGIMKKMDRVYYNNIKNEVYQN